MKRNELKVGEEYAVLAPSQKFHPGRYGGVPSARRVMVLDTEPVWKSLSYYSHHRDDDKVRPVTYNGEKVQPRFDDSFKVKVEEGSSFYTAEAKRSVKVLEVRHSWREDAPEYVITTVPLSQIRMTWAEFESEARKVRAEFNRIEKARDERRRVEERAAEQRRTQRDKLAAVLEGSRFDARIREGGVVITGTHEDLMAVALLIRATRSLDR